MQVAHTSLRSGDAPHHPGPFHRQRTAYGVRLTAKSGKRKAESPSSPHHQVPFLKQKSNFMLFLRKRVLAQPYSYGSVLPHRTHNDLR